jgi:hypothetical protein
MISKFRACPLSGIFGFRKSIAQRLENLELLHGNASLKGSQKRYGISATYFSITGKLKVALPPLFTRGFADNAEARYW